MEKTIEVTEITYTPKGAKKLKTKDGYFYLGSKDFSKADIRDLGTYSVVYEASEFKGNTLNWIKSASGMPSNGSQPPVLATNGNGVWDRARQEGIGRSVALNNSVLMVQAFANAWHSTESIKNRTPEDIQEMLRNLKDDEYVANLQLLGITPNDEDTTGM